MSEKDKLDKVQGLSGFFGFTTKKRKGSNRRTVVPAEIKKKDGKETLTPVNITPELQRVLDYFESDYTKIDLSTYDSMKNMWDELEFMVINEGLLNTACQVYTDETTQADAQERILNIQARDRKIEKHFYEWVNSIGLTNGLIENIAYDLTQFGNHFWANQIDYEDGVVGVTPINIREVKQRMEFNLTQFKDYKSTVSQSSSQKLQSLAKELDQKSLKQLDLKHKYQNYFFGYELSDGSVLPPWGLTHFRRFTTQSDIFPFGKPLLMGSLSRYKSLKNTELIIDMARVASFPKDHYTVKVSEGSGPAEVYQRVNEVRRLIENLTPKTETKDRISIGEATYSVEGMYDYKQWESRLDINKLADYNMKREDLVLSTGLPVGVLDPSKGASGRGGASLIQQNKMVARRVYTNQTAILEALTQLYKIHLLITGEFEKEDTEFILSLNFPILEMDSERTRTMNDLLRLSKDILDNLGTSLGLERGESLPVEVVKDIFARYSFLTPDELDDWVKVLEKERSKEQEETVKKKLSNRPIQEEIFREAYVSAFTRVGLYEGVMAGTHYYSSSNKANISGLNSITYLREDMEMSKKQALKG